jgi:hypothetical protein
VKEWENVYVFSFTFAPLSPLFIVFYLFFCSSPNVAFYLSSINRTLYVWCERVVVRFTSVALNPVGSMPLLFVNPRIVLSFERPGKYRNIVKRQLFNGGIRDGKAR